MLIITDSQFGRIMKKVSERKSVEKLSQNLKQDNGNVTSNIVFRWEQEGLH